jgi:hypothetical protein
MRRYMPINAAPGNSIDRTSSTGNVRRVANPNLWGSQEAEVFRSLPARSMRLPAAIESTAKIRESRLVVCQFLTRELNNSVRIQRRDVVAASSCDQRLCWVVSVALAAWPNWD